MIEKRLRNLIVSGFGADLRCERGLIKVSQDGRSVRLTPRKLEQVIITGDASITSGLVTLLLENNVDLVFIGKGHRFFARVARADSNFITELWRKQILMSEERRMEFGREIISCSIYNKTRFLYSLSKNRARVSFDKHIMKLKEVRAMVREAESREVLTGIEGEATRVYFSALKEVIPPEFGFVKREKHPPPCPVNSMLGYGYTVLKSRVEYGLLLAGLNPYEGVVHLTYRNRPALSFDLTEVFRQPIVDRVAITQIVKKQLHPEDFDFNEDGSCYLCELAKKAFLEALYSRFEDRYTYNGMRISFLDIILEEAKRLASAIENDERYVGFRYR